MNETSEIALQAQTAFSVVIPIYNEEENIPELYQRLTAAMESLCVQAGKSLGDYEIIMVDDGSRDRSWELISDLHGKDPRLKGLSFSRNFGHHIAITAGLDHAKGMAVVLMDGDLQDPPEEISNFYEKLRSGVDIVYGRRIERQDSFLKKLFSHLFWKVLRIFSGVDIPTGQTMMRMLSRRLVDALKEMREYARFVHGMMAWVGFNTAVIEVRHSPRMKGKSKYNVYRLISLALHAITSFSVLPLRFAMYIGFASSLISFLIGILLIVRKLMYNIPVGYSSIVVSIFFVGGVQMLLLGVIGEYLGRTYQAMQQRPLYILKDVL